MRSHKNEIRVVLFDVGGVLVELSGLTKLLTWLGNGITPEQAFTFWLTSPIVRSFETGRMEAKPFAEQVIVEMGLPVSRDDFLVEFGTWSQRLLPGAIDLVRRVPRRYVRATLCNTNSIQWPGLMTHRDLIEGFDRHFPSHLTGKIKPDEEAFQHVLATLKCNAPEVLFLDDNILNIAAAERVGVAAIQVRGPLEAERALLAAGVIT